MSSAMTMMPRPTAPPAHSSRRTIWLAPALAFAVSVSFTAACDGDASDEAGSTSGRAEGSTGSTESSTSDVGGTGGTGTSASDGATGTSGTDTSEASTTGFGTGSSGTSSVTTGEGSTSTATSAATSGSATESTTGLETTGTSDAGSGTVDGGESETGSVDGETVVEIGDDVVFDDARRFGMNLGSIYQYGESNMLENIIPSPGFEPAEFGTVFIVGEGATPEVVQAAHWNTAWNNDAQGVGHPVGFWDGASYEILLGPAAGRTGTVTEFTHEDGRYTFELDGDGAAPEAGNLLLVRTEIPGYQARTLGNYSAEPTQTRPLSTGTQALRLHPSPGQSYRVIYDTHGDPNAPKLFLVEGTWRFAVWARAEAPGQTLTASFRRTVEPPFWSETIPLTTEWQYIERTFSVPAGADPQVAPGAPHNPLQFGLAIGAGGSNDVLIDDMVLERADDESPTAFAGEFVDALTELRPGILRNWGAQLGSSLDNELADPFSRHSLGYAPNSRRATNWHFSLHEFLELCAAVGADPWYVIPPTWSQQELDDFVAYLAAPAGTHPYAGRRAALGQAAPWTEVFRTIHLEYGNETWASGIPGTDPFAGATFGGGINAGQVHDARFSYMRQNPWFDATLFNLVIGGQANFPGRQQQLVDNSDAHDAIGLAPYFGSLTDESSLAAWFRPLYAHATQMLVNGPMSMNRAILEAADTQMAIYEIAVHTVDTGSGATRNEVLSSQAGAISLPLVMLTYLRAWQVRDQVAYKALQFSFFRSNAWLRVFGMLRDIRAGAHRRPSWLALQLTNSAILPELVEVTVTGDVPTWTQPPQNGILETIEVPEVQAFAFRDAANGERSAVLFNLSLDTVHDVRLALPDAPAGPATLSRLAAAEPTDDNETDVNVTIEDDVLLDFSEDSVLELAPHSMTVVRWQSL